MKKLLLCLLCMLSLKAQAETKFNINGDAYVRGYFRNGTGPNHTQAFNQFFRIKAEARPDENMALKSGLVLSGNSWEGDNHTTAATATGSDQDGGGGDSTRLDHAFIEYAKESWILSAGRQAVSTPGCFLTCDDRRDRILIGKIMPGYELFAFAYDKRFEGLPNNAKDDTDMITVAYYGSLPIFKYALQVGYFKQKTPTPLISLDQIKQFTPQISGQLLGFDYNIYYSLLFGGSVLYKETHHSGAFHISRDLGFVKVDYESVFTLNGGLVVNGFDTLSSIINSSPDHNQSSIRVKSIGLGLGREGADEFTHIIKLSKSPIADFTISVGGGIARLYNYALTEATSSLETNSVLDLTTKYDMTKNLNLALAYGKFFGDNQDHAGSLSLNAKF